MTLIDQAFKLSGHAHEGMRGNVQTRLYRAALHLPSCLNARKSHVIVLLRWETVQMLDRPSADCLSPEYLVLCMRSTHHTSTTA